MLVDMATEIEAARLLTHRAATLRDAGVRHTTEAAMAKLRASDVAAALAWVLAAAVVILAVFGVMGELRAVRLPGVESASQISSATWERAAESWRS
jgi:alkylation response protein AidB-like acyl-CoA dehydrogenase